MCDPKIVSKTSLRVVVLLNLRPTHNHTLHSVSHLYYLLCSSHQMINSASLNLLVVTAGVTVTATAPIATAGLPLSTECNIWFETTGTGARLRAPDCRLQQEGNFPVETKGIGSRGRAKLHKTHTFFCALTLHSSTSSRNAVCRLFRCLYLSFIVAA